MLKKLFLVLLTLLAIASHQTAVLAGAAPETAGQILARLSKLAPEQRQAALMEKAKVEGEINFYSTLQAQQDRTVLAGLPQALSVREARAHAGFR